MLTRFSRSVGLAVAVVLTALSLTGSASAWTLNAVVLDNGQCYRNLQIGSDKTASSSATPSFLLSGDGWAAQYQMFVDGASIGTFPADSNGNVCILTPVPLAEGPHTLSGNELTPRVLTVIPFAFTVDSFLRRRLRLPRWSPSVTPGSWATTSRSTPLPR